MSYQLNVDDLWKSLSPQEIKDGCRALLEAAHPILRRPREGILNELATALRFRPVFLHRRSTAENLPFLLKRIHGHGFERFHDDVIKAWLIDQHRPMFEAFLSTSGIPQNGGFVEDEAPPPSSQHLELGIRRIMAEFRHRDVGIYLGFLVLFGGDFWKSLIMAMVNTHVVIIDLLNSEQAAPSADESPSSELAVNPDGPEDSDAFTSLDNLLIRSAVSSAFEESGAQSPEQLEDLIEEVVSLNSQRQHSLFHRGFFHALFGRPFVFHFPGENEERRLWYFTGVVFGLLRANREAEVLELLKGNPDIVGQLCQNKKVRCGSMLLPQVYPILWNAKQFGLGQRWLESQLTRLPEGQCLRMIIEVHEDAASLVRRGQWVEAEGFLNFLDELVRNAKALPRGFPDYFLPRNERKRAQVLQLKGDLAGAEAVLKSLAMIETLEDRGNVIADIGLIRAGVRSLAAVLPTKDEPAGLAIADAMLREREWFEKATVECPDTAANANFCLGLIAVLRNESAQAASDRLKAALAGMLPKEDLYAEGGIIQWNRFLLGLSLLESAEPAGFQYARDLIEQSIQTPVGFPLWLWSRAMHAAAVFDDQSLGERIADHLLKKRGTNAHNAIWKSGLACSVGSLRAIYLTWLEDSPMSLPEKWEQLKVLLPAALRDSDLHQARIILDSMEGMAIQAEKYREEFLRLLDDDRSFSPAWTPESAISVRIKLNEQAGNVANATVLLRSRFFAAREAGDETQRQEAEGILDWMAELGTDTAELDELRKLLPWQRVEEEPEAGCPLANGTPVSVLYIGGNETQIAYEDSIRGSLHSRYPGLKVEFYFPGWSSKWNVQLDQVRPKLFQADVVVLSKMVRTQFGQHIRALCDSSRPWFPCTGKGKQSLTRSIEFAARWVASKKCNLISS